MDGSLSAGAEDDFAVVMGDLFDLQVAEPAAKYNVGLFQETNVEAFIEEYDWLQVATEVASEARFVHYDLIFADILKARGGFDLIVGNPPWARPSWNEGQVLADLDPLYSGLAASEAKNIMVQSLKKAGAVNEFLHEYSLIRGGIGVTSSPVMNPFVGGGANNLYRCFIDLSFRIIAPLGYVGLIHQDGHLVDPKAGGLRSHWYPRIVKHYHFRNEIKKKMFAEIGNTPEFSLNIYRGKKSDIRFDQFTSAFLPSQIDESFLDLDGAGDLPVIKKADGNWETRGHKNRIIRIDRVALEIIHSLTEEEHIPVEEARFIQPFSSSTLQVFKQLSSFTKVGNTFVDFNGVATWQMGHDWNETTDTKKTKIIKRTTAYRPIEEMVIQGPLIYVGNPLYKTPRRVSNTHKDYDVIDLLSLPENYLPRTNFGPAILFVDYRLRMTKCRWDRSKYHGDFYRVAVRNMIAPNGERSFISAVIPPKVLHVDAVESIAFKDNSSLLNFAGLSFSLVYDFLVKASGISNLRSSFASQLPYTNVGSLVRNRVLALSSLNVEYKELWNTCVDGEGLMNWSNENFLVMPKTLSSKWSRETALRSDYSRRITLIEIDVLVSQALGLTLDQLIEMFRIYFPVLQDNEAGTWYDKNGRIVWTCSMGLQRVGYLNEKGQSPGRKEWESIFDSNPAELMCTVIDDTLPDGPHTVERHFIGPFFKCDRIEDYKRAWAHFEKLGQEGAL